MSQRRDWEDIECRQIFRLCVLQISVLNPAVHGKPPFAFAQALGPGTERCGLVSTL